MTTSDLIDIWVTLLGAINVFAFVTYNQKRIRELITFLTIQSCNENNLLHKRQLAELLADYNGFLGYTLWFPDHEKYKYLYRDSNLLEMRKKSKKRLVYFIIGFVLFISLKVYLY
jgi:hypothetical protein